VDAKALVADNRRLDAANRRLRSRVLAMETFLSDYGLVWKGAADDDDDEAAAEATAAGAAAARLLPGEAAAVAAVAAGQPHFDLFFAKVADLNGLLDGGGAKVVMDGKRATYQ
jgi:hypothetical protein